MRSNGRFPFVEAAILKALLDGETITAVEFAKAHNLNRSSTSSMLSLLKDYCHCRHLTESHIKNGKGRIAYSCKERVQLQIKLDEIYELFGERGRYDFEPLLDFMGIPAHPERLHRAPMSPHIRPRVHVCFDTIE